MHESLFEASEMYLYRQGDQSRSIAQIHLALGWACRSWSGPVIHKILQFLTGLEEGNTFGRHLDLGTGLWVAPGSSAALARAKAPETADFDLFTTLESLNDVSEDRFDDDLRLFARQFGDANNFFDQVRLCYGGVVHNHVLRYNQDRAGQQVTQLPSGANWRPMLTTKLPFR